MAEAVLDGRLAPDTWIAAPGGSRWIRASDVPVIAQLLDGQPTKRAPDSPEAPYHAGGDTLESPGNERRRR